MVDDVLRDVLLRSRELVEPRLDIRGKGLVPARLVGRARRRRSRSLHGRGLFRRLAQRSSLALNHDAPDQEPDASCRPAPFPPGGPATRAWRGVCAPTAALAVDMKIVPHTRQGHPPSCAGMFVVRLPAMSSREALLRELRA